MSDVDLKLNRLMSKLNQVMDGLDSGEIKASDETERMVDDLDSKISDLEKLYRKDSEE